MKELLDEILENEGEEGVRAYLEFVEEYYDVTEEDCEL